jgi:UDP-glucose 4-epimerase
VRRVLIRGASGFLGRHVARRLLARGQIVRLQVRRTGRLPDDLRAHPCAEIVEGDVQDERVVRESLDSVEAVIDFVGSTLPASPAASFRAEVDLTLRPLGLLLDAMEDVGVEQLVVPSSGGTIYGRTEGQKVTEDTRLLPESYYGLGKQVAEEMIRFRGRRPGLEYLILRIANPYGREASATVNQGAVDVFLECASNGRSVDVWGDGSQLRDYIFIDDVVDAVEAALASGVWNETFNVGTGVGTSLNDLVETVERVTGQRLARRRRGDVYAGVPVNVLDPSRLCGATGWSPRYDLQAGIEEAWNRLRRAR